ncbi:hypothetical protein PR202_ga00501 [Eleusine coracana subsp. coracana]|uniref:Glucose-methanol-choline oxidoreductase N-terminal domain-containing protein n=1 Tax=Eleusine coracana subsp. coracana TaxID=191504 RepID=A0AAV5BDA9_ELECO|nr:hypothetical protein PR202_ga00501 [Eleusine coracana subsp. coracana]
MDRHYEKGGIFCSTNVTTVLFAGTTVGGGSAVNWCPASIRNPEAVKREWAREHGLPVFASLEYGRAMDAVYTRLGVAAV